MPPLTEEARALFDAAPCGLARTAADGTFILVNRTFCNWIGSPPEALIGKRKFQDLLTIGARIFHQTHWAPLLAMQGSISEVRLELLQPTGGPIPLVVNALARPSEAGRVHELAAYVARDRDKYERELVLSRKRLESLLAETALLHEQSRDRAQFAEQMVGIVSHDLRNPVATIQTGAALLLRSPEAASRDRLLSSILRASERANRLINDLLDFTQARVGAGIAVRLQSISLHSVVADAVSELALAYPARRLQHLASGEGECEADAERLEQLLGNLVSNAMAYGDAQAPVTVTSWIEAKSFGVSVHNFGPAIPADAVATLFQPMTRGAKAREGRSVGLGLFIVNEIALAHGGYTKVESSAERGTTFQTVFNHRKERST